MCDCDCEHPKVYEQSSPVARKPHRCCECRRIIKPGERYHSFFGVYSWSAERYKWCENCQSLRQTLEEAGHCACFTELHEVAAEERVASHVSWRTELEEV